MKIAYIAGALLLLTAGLYIYNSESTRLVKKYRKNAFHGLSQLRVKTVFYEHRMLIDTTQISDDGITTERVRIQTDSKAFIEPTLMAAAAQYNIKLGFSEYNLLKLDVMQDNKIVNYNYDKSDDTDLDIFFEAVMDYYSGELLSIKRVPGPEFEMIDTVAADLLRQAFPNIQRSGFLLGQTQQEIEFGTDEVNINVDLG